MFLKYEHLAWIVGFFALSLIGGCTPDPGTLDDSSQEELEDALGVGLRDPIDPFLPVPPNPFQPGDERLSVGYFYEGGRSETIPINTVTTDYFVFPVDVNEPVATRTFAEGTSSDRLEGLISYEITLIDPPAGCARPCFWGGGIIWFEPIDLSDWTTMFVGFKSSDPSFATFNLTLLSGEGDLAAAVDLDPTAYGYANDGEWHFLEIPLQDAINAGFDPSAVRSPFIIGADGAQPGDVMLVDNLYLTKADSSGTGGTGGTPTCNSTARGFIKTIDAMNNFATTNEVTQDTTAIPETWDRYSLELLIDAGLEGQLLQVGFSATASNDQPSGVFYDNIVVDPDAQYTEDFESLDQADPDALGNDGWLVFGNIFSPDGETYIRGYGPDPAPNNSGAFSGIALDEGGVEQGDQVLVIISDYNNRQDQQAGNRVEANTYREREITAQDVDTTITFSFDAKRGNINEGCPVP